jgi:hypothetical protein
MYGLTGHKQGLLLQQNSLDTVTFFTHITCINVSGVATAVLLTLFCHFLKFSGSNSRNVTCIGFEVLIVNVDIVVF